MGKSTVHIKQTWTLICRRQIISSRYNIRTATLEWHSKISSDDKTLSPLILVHHATKFIPSSFRSCVLFSLHMRVNYTHIFIQLFTGYLGMFCYHVGCFYMWNTFVKHTKPLSNFEPQEMNAAVLNFLVQSYFTFTDSCRRALQQSTKGLRSQQRIIRDCCWKMVDLVGSK